VAFAAGALLGGAFFHMLPAAIRQWPDDEFGFVWVMLGFIVFFALEQLLHWHRCRRPHADHKEPLTYLILLGDALHNFVGGLAVAGTFLFDARMGVAAWIAAAAHEVPQELGDFGVLIHGGWSKGRALAVNVLSASTFLLGGLLAYVSSARIDVAFLVPFAAGNFIYIGAADLVPEVFQRQPSRGRAVEFVAFLAGVVLLWLVGRGFS
jgi:zinc and cadmium transporter